jgi:hypothetical protein
MFKVSGCSSIQRTKLNTVNSIVNFSKNELETWNKAQAFYLKPDSSPEASGRTDEAIAE